MPSTLTTLGVGSASPTEPVTPYPSLRSASAG